MLSLFIYGLDAFPAIQTNRDKAVKQTQKMGSELKM